MIVSYLNTAMRYLPPAQRRGYYFQQCLFVCLFVNTITPERLEISGKFSGHHTMQKGAGQVRQESLADTKVYKRATAVRV